MASRKDQSPTRGLVVSSTDASVTLGVSISQTPQAALAAAPTITIPNSAAPVIWTQQNCSDMLAFLTAFANTGIVGVVPRFTTVIANAPFFRPGTPPLLVIPHAAGNIYWTRQNVIDLQPSIAAFAASGTLS
jgi:hypothetical protein